MKRKHQSFWRKKNAEKDLTFRNDWAFWWFGNIIILPKICCSVALVTGTFPIVPLYFWRVLIQRFISETKSFTPNSASLSSTRRVQRSILDLRSIFRQTYDLASASASKCCAIQNLWGLSNEILCIWMAGRQSCKRLKFQLRTNALSWACEKLYYTNSFLFSNRYYKLKSLFF